MEVGDWMGVERPELESAPRGPRREKYRGTLSQKEDHVSGILLSPIICPPPKGWRELDVKLPFPGARAYGNRDGLRALTSIEPRGDKQWAHVSCSRGDRLPTWEDLKLVKEVFLGDVMAYQVLPPKAEWLNVHEFTLHLFHCLSGDPFAGCFGLED